MSSAITRTLAAAAVSLSLAGCGAITGEGAADGRQVVASFYPLAWVTGEVAGERWTVSNLTAAGGEPHDLELSIEATAAVADADLVVLLSGFQPAVDETVDTNATGSTLDAARVVDLQPAAEHAAEHGTGEEDGHDHGDLDPHFWLDPARMATLAVAVGTELAELDPDHAEVYQDNAAELASRLEQLDRELADGLTGCERDVVVVTHDAFGYLAKYGLHFEAITGLSPGAEPTPATLAELSDVIEDEGLTTVFSERLASPAMAKTLADDLGITTATLDPLEGLTDETADEDYLSLMRDNLAALQEANGC